MSWRVVSLIKPKHRPTADPTVAVMTESNMRPGFDTKILWLPIFKVLF